MSLFHDPELDGSEPHDAGITTAVQRYIDGYVGQEAPTLRATFHAQAQLITLDEGAVAPASTAAWFDRIEAKRAGGGGTLVARHRILGVDQGGAAAVAKVELVLASHTFLDYLALLKTAKGWRIVNKIYVARPNAAADTSP